TCSSRFITFRDLMDSEVKNAGSASDPKWTIESLKNGKPAPGVSSGNPVAEGFPDVRCAVENAEFLVVDQVPSVEIAATLITGLVTFPDSGQQQLRSHDTVGPSGSTSYTTKERMDNLAQTVESQGEKNMEAFLRAMNGKIVIWLLDNERIVDDWRRLLLRYYDFNQLRIMDPTTE
ncbi:MAG TPA: hypothetical protein VKA94_07775, partial [Hyphomicrobiales bacterium]|nr:hypothetical protein [Hyphomicrobiales bacterium]